MYSSEEIGFIFLDMTRVDFFNWNSKYLLKPIEVDPKKAINVLSDFAEEESHKIVFIHIEECDMVFVDRELLERALDKLRKKNNVYIVYSTSRIDRSYLAEWLEKYIDMKII